MKLSKIFLIGLSALLFLMIGCSSSKTDNEAAKNKTKVETKELSAVELEDNFDLSAYHENIEISKNNGAEDLENLNLWYGYNDADIPNSDSIEQGTEYVHGFRVIVLSTDDLQKANDMKSELYFKTNQKSIYVDFEPPFYNVKIGDFVDLKDANNLKFKLNQLGYQDARVINENVNALKLK